MKTRIPKLSLSMFCGCLLSVGLHGQTTIEGFEYATDTDLRAKWTPTAATLTLSPNVAVGAAGAKSMKVTGNFDTGAWVNERIVGPTYSTPLSLGTNQYITLRVAGDPAFTNATFRQMYVYAYDDTGRFGRWGSLVPTVTNWCVLNLRVGTIVQPDGGELPDLAKIVNFHIVVFGQGASGGPVAYDWVLYIDDLQLRDTPLLPPAPADGITMVEDFEKYDSDFALSSAWLPDMGTVTLSPYVAAGSKGTNSLLSQRSYSGAWATEVLTGPQLPYALAIKTNQFVTIRVAGDPAFTNSGHRYFYIYAWDGAGNYGRWQASVPTSTNWQIMNVPVTPVEQPWDMKIPPDLNNIVQFKIYVYGQGGGGGDAYTGNLNFDDLQIRNSALIEFGPPSPMRTFLDNFEGYADDTALRAFYSYDPSGATPTASLESPAPQGSKALKLAVDFTSIQYPWGAVRSATQTRFSFPSNAAVQLRFKGDPAMASVADAGTSFWFEFFDDAGRRLSNSQISGQAVANGEWTTARLPYSSFRSGTPVDTGNLTQWRILVQGWTGSPSGSPGPMSGTFYVDDIQIVIVPTAAVIREGTALKLKMDNLISGKTYTIRQTGDFATWSNAGTVTATSSTATWDIPSGTKGYFQVSYTP